MTQLRWKYWLNHAFLTLSFLIAPFPAIAREEPAPISPVGFGALKESAPVSYINLERLNSEELNIQPDQVSPEATNEILWSRTPSVSELSDVQSSDWAVEAILFLVQTYEIDQRGLNAIFVEDRALTRYEFAALLHQVLNQFADEMIQVGEIAQDDLSILQRLRTEFSAELAQMGDRISLLESQVDEIAANQFSVTTTLRGDASFLIADVFGKDTNTNTTASYRARLRFDTTFTGEDLLRVRIRAGNFEQFDIKDAGNEVRLSSTSSSDDDVGLSSFQYRFPVGDQITVYAVANGGDMTTFTDTINPLRGSTISRFGNRNPIYRVPRANAGLGASVELLEDLSFDFGYLAGRASDPRPRRGLFNGDYGAIAQLTLNTSRFDVGLTYIHAYSTDGDVNTRTGSELAEVSGTRQPVVSNSYGVQANFRVSRGFELGGWVGYTSAHVIETGDADVWNYAVTLTFPDLGGEGNQGGLIIGMQPRLTSATPGLAKELGGERDAGVGLHLEGFYEYRLNDFITITPAIVWLTAPNHDTGNPDIVIGSIRTEFRF